MLVTSVEELIGNTPIFNVTYKNQNIFIKLEKYNAGGSIKDRAVLKMLEQAEARGELQAGDVLIEATSGNTGIALSMLGTAKGYKVIIIMPEIMSIERRMLMKAYGAELVLTEGSKGMQGSIDKMNELMREHSNYRSLRQFDNKDNPLAHYETTAREIVKDVPDVKTFCAGIGTGGTISGISRYLKEYDSTIVTVGVEPASSPLLTSGHSGSHKIQGIGANFIPSNYDSSVVDTVITITDEEAYEEVRWLARNYGILVGISSGCNVAAAKKLIDKDYTNVVTVAPDGIEKYLNNGIY